jgi:integrase
MKDNWKVTSSKTATKSCVNIYFKGERFRFSNGKQIGLAIKASENLELLKSAFELKLLEGWRPAKLKLKGDEPISLELISQIKLEVDKIQNGNYSYHHKRDCKWVFSELSKFLSSLGRQSLVLEELDSEILFDFISQSKWSNRTQKNVLTTLKCISKHPLKEHLNRIKIRRAKSTLHKPIKEVEELLKDLKRHNHNLYLCCLITYGCLLRPHQEIRLLKWSDIDLNKGFISLSGDRNKSGRNRIVPIPNYVKEELLKLEPESSGYLFSNNGNAFSRDYFSILWKRYKAKTEKDLRGITLYSFRHTGAIKVFEKTGSLLKLQQVMGHSDMKVSLTYLRGLEVKELDVQDLPEL